MLVGGIDPGKKGYLVIVSTEDNFSPVVFKLPYDKDGELNPHLFSAAISVVDVVFSERPLVVNTNAKGSEAFSSTGVATRLVDFGGIRELVKLAKKKFVAVMPGQWKAAYKLSSNKQKSIDWVKKHYPNVNLIPEGCRVESHDIAEALLIAHYGKASILAS